MAFNRNNLNGLIFAFLLLRPAAGSENLEVLILHTNDMHSKFEEVTQLANSCNESEKNNTCVGGFARMAHQIRKYRQWGAENGKNVLFLNAGDIFVGSDWFSVHRWRICAELLNALQPDVVTLGNHEFDDGLDDLKQFTTALKCPIVSANFDVAQVPPVQKSTVLDVNGAKVGVIGYLTRETSYTSGAEMLNITDELTSVREESERLTDEGVKILIGLGHSGFDIDKKLAEEVPLLDLVIGGHSNTFLWNGDQPSVEKIEGPYPYVVTQKSGKKVPVVQAYAYTLYLGRLNVTFNQNGDLISFSGQPEYMSSDIPQDGDVLAMLERYRAGIEEINREIVGKSSVYLDGVCRMKECNFGNLVTDAMVYYSAYNNQEDANAWTSAAIALYNGGNLRNSINVTYTQGNITKGELLAALPFENEVVSIDLKGADLLAAMEHAVHNHESTLNNPQFLQISGMRVEYDLRRAKGSRVVSIKVRCTNCTIPRYENLDPEAEYRVMTTDFLTNGGDGFGMIKNNGRDLKKYGLTLNELLMWYLKLQSPVYPEVQGRIQFAESVEANFGISATPSGSVFAFLLCSILIVSIN